MQEPGWYPDPLNSNHHAWWDGQRWIPDSYRLTPSAQGKVARAERPGLLNGSRLAKTLKSELALAEGYAAQLAFDLEVANNRIDELAQSLKHEQEAHAALRSFVDKHGGEQVWEADEVISSLKQEQEKLATTIARLTKEESELQKRLRPQRLRASEEAVGWYDFDHPAQDSIALAVELKTLRQEIAAKVRGFHAVQSLDDIEIPTTKARRTKIIKDNARLVLRAFNAEVENIIDKATATNFEASLNKLYKSAEALEKLTEVSQIKLAPDYIELRIRELHLAVKHLDAKKLERELERERKAELREQAQAERELEAERKRLEKEKQHYVNVLRAVEATGDQPEIEKLRAELVAIEKGINDVDERVANIRAGYVYVISNVGSFGDNMVKIGLTRRLDPLDRVRELSDASVPFNFDVHALFFSDDAVGVEAMLHRRFADRKANLINQRREFFLVSPSEVREVLKEIGGNILEFVEEPEAEQYRQTQALRASIGGQTHS